MLLVCRYSADRYVFCWSAGILPINLTLRSHEIQPNLCDLIAVDLMTLTACKYNLVMFAGVSVSEHDHPRSAGWSRALLGTRWGRSNQTSRWGPTRPARGSGCVGTHPHHKPEPFTDQSFRQLPAPPASQSAWQLTAPCQQWHRWVTPIPVGLLTSGKWAKLEHVDQYRYRRNGKVGRKDALLSNFQK